MDYAAHYAKLIERGQARQSVVGFVEMHHIIPRCMGGSDDWENLVRLTAEEHCIAHLLLAKMHPENVKITFAAKHMSGRMPDLKRPKNKRYGKARRLEVSRWGRIKKRNVIRARKRRRRGYRRKDVDRLAKMLRPIADFT